MPGEYEDIVADERVVRSIRVRPDYQTWDDSPIINATPSWKKKKDRFEDWVSDNLGFSVNIDEIAVMFDQYNEEGMNGFLKDAVREPHVKLFNVAWDHVTTGPIRSEYDVEYNFLEVEDLGMRVEVMRIDRGVSPLHASMLPGNYNPTLVDSGDPLLAGPAVVHFSFKVNRGEYEEVCEALLDTEAEMVQSCESTYGLFSYWRIPSIGENIYLKPRVNMRDAEIILPPPPNTTDRGEFGMPTIGRPIRDVPQA